MNNNTYPEQKYDTKEEAIRQYIEQGNIKESIVQLNLNNHKKLILTEDRTDIYYVSELIEADGKFSIIKISVGVDIGNTNGVSWGFSTIDNKYFTISISKDKEQNSLHYINELELGVAIAEGNNIVDTKTLTNLIQSYEILK